MILSVNHKSEKSTLNMTTLYKSMDKELEHGWELTLTIDLVSHVKYALVIPLGVAKKSSIN